jgi:hypothetical protein
MHLDRFQARFFGRLETNETSALAILFVALSTYRIGWAPLSAMGAISILRNHCRLPKKLLKINYQKT